MMTQQEIDLMNFENELLHTRRKLNDLIYQLSHQEQTPEDRALCQEKIFYLETELTYMNQQFRLLKNRQAAQASTQFAQTQGGRPQAAFGAEPARKPQTTAQSAQAQEPQTTAQSSQTQEPQTALSFHTEPPRKDYERIFGKSFMGIFASVLIFIHNSGSFFNDFLKPFGIKGNGFVSDKALLRIAEHLQTDACF